jgi:hypothetical protein
LSGGEPVHQGHPQRPIALLRRVTNALRSTVWPSGRVVAEQARVEVHVALLAEPLLFCKEATVLSLQRGEYTVVEKLRRSPPPGRRVAYGGMRSGGARRGSAALRFA